MGIEFIIIIAVLIFSVIIHEVAHGLMAYYLGDPTAKYAGRLTLNPVSHLDPVGSFLVPLLMVIAGAFTGRGMILGWAKPVPYNPYNLRDQKWGPALVGFAGPLSNILLLLVTGITAHVLYAANGTENLILDIIIRVNIALTVFNLLPIPPLDGSKLLFSILPISEYTKSTLDQYGFVFLILLIATPLGSLIGFLIEGARGLFMNSIVY